MPESLIGRYQLIREIGRGGFGVVEEYCDLVTGSPVAIKTVAPYFIKQETKRLIREIDIMRFLYCGHAHVINFSSMFVTRCRGGVDSKSSQPAPSSHRLNVLGSEYQGLSPAEKVALHYRYLAEDVNTVRKDEAFSLHIVMPLMNGDLTGFIREVATPDADRRTRQVSSGFLTVAAAVFAFQLFFGLDYLHRCGIIHRDLKPENILVRLENDSAYDSSVCIADMGLARDNQDSDTFYVCTRYYRPPEVVMTAIRGHPGLDVWSMGCILYEMCTNHTLFTVASALDEHGTWEGVRASSQLEVIMNIVGTPSKEDTARYMPNGNASSYLMRSSPRPSILVEKIRNHFILKCDEHVKNLWIDLIVRCLAFYPQMRPSPEQACRHALFSHYNLMPGVNVHQTATQKYVPTYSDRETSRSLTDDNKGRILDLVRSTLVLTTPILTRANEEEGDEEDEEDEQDGDGAGAEYMLGSQSDAIIRDDDEDHSDDEDHENDLFTSTHRGGGGARSTERNEDEDEEEGSYLANSASMRAISTSTGRGKHSSARNDSIPNKSSNRNRSRNSRRSGNEERDEGEGDAMLSAMQYASALRLTRDTTEEDDRDNEGLTSRRDSSSGGDQASRSSTGPRGQSRGSLMHPNAGRGTSNDSTTRSAISGGSSNDVENGSGQVGSSAYGDSSVRGPVQRAPSVFYASTQRQQQQPAATAPGFRVTAGASAGHGDELDEAGQFTRGGGTADWFAPSFFNMTRGHATGSAESAHQQGTAQQPKPNASTSAPASAAGGPRKSGLVRTVYASLSADALHSVLLQSQPRVSGAGAGGSSGVLRHSLNASSGYLQQSSGGAAKVSGSYGSAQVSSSSHPLDLPLPEEYDFFDDADFALLQSSAGVTGVTSSSTTSGPRARRLPNAMTPTLAAAATRGQASGTNDSFSNAHGISGGMGSRGGGVSSTMAASVTHPASAAHVQPLQPMSNNYFSTANLGMLRLDRVGDGSALAVSTGDGARKDGAIRIVSPANEAMIRGGNAHVEDDEDDDDEAWAVPPLSPYGSSAHLAVPHVSGGARKSSGADFPANGGSGSPFSRGDTSGHRASNATGVNGNGGNSATARADSFARMLEQVAMGDAEDLLLYDSALTHVPDGARGDRSATGAADPTDFGSRTYSMSIEENSGGGGSSTVADDNEFPIIADSALRMRYRRTEATSEGAEGAIRSILTEMDGSTHDSSKSEQLRALLAYFTSLQRSLRTSS